MKPGLTRPFLAALTCLVLAGPPACAAVQDPATPGVPAQAPKEVKIMTDAQRAKLDAFLKQAVTDKRPESLGVLIRPVEEDGAMARLGDVLTKLGLKVTRTMSGGRLLLVTLKAEQLPDIVASADVARVSFDAFVTPQVK